jgi:hypothetical protein
MSTQGETSDAAVRELLERLFLRHRHAPEPLLLVGELPPEWDIPLPQGAEVVGSLGTAEFQSQVVLNLPGEPEQAMAEVERALTAGGWRSGQWMPGMRASGFVPAGAAIPRAGSLLCDDQRRRHLRVSAGPGEGGLADVRLNLNSDPDSFAICEGGGRMHWDPTSVFPALIPPPGMSQRGGGSGGGGGGGSSHAQTTLRGDLAVDEVERHYREQLVAAGWRLNEHAASGRWAWSAWDFTDERGDAWTGLLTVAEPQGQASVRHVALLALSARGGPGSSSTMRLMGSG